MLGDANFVKWLASKLNYRPGRLLQLLRNNSEEYTWTPRNSLNTEISILVYNFWKNKAIVSVDRRNGRDRIKVNKVEYLHANSRFTDIDDNIQEEIKKFKKIKYRKTYFTASRMIQSESVNILFDVFKRNGNSNISKSSFFKFRPFYIVPATEREKECCLCSMFECSLPFGCY